MAELRKTAENDYVEVVEPVDNDGNSNVGIGKGGKPQGFVVINYGKAVILLISVCAVLLGGIFYLIKDQRDDDRKFKEEFKKQTEQDFKTLGEKFDAVKSVIESALVRVGEMSTRFQVNDQTMTEFSKRLNGVVENMGMLKANQANTEKRVDRIEDYMRGKVER